MMFIIARRHYETWMHGTGVIRLVYKKSRVNRRKGIITIKLNMIVNASTIQPFYFHSKS
jgi:hypothetical protein